MVELNRINHDYHKGKIRFRMWSEKLQCHLRELTTEDMEGHFLAVLHSSRIIFGSLQETSSIGLYIDDVHAKVVRTLSEIKELYLIKYNE